MLIMKKGMPVNSGKTTEALKKVIELLSNDQSVLYVNNELSYKFIWNRLVELSNNDSITDKFYFYNGENLEQLITQIKSDELKNASIVVDIGKDVSDFECNQDLYVYYQTPIGLR